MTTSLFGASAAAKKLRVSLRSVQRAALNHDIGLVISGRRVFSSDDIPRLKAVIPKKVGNPNFVVGNDLWTRRKKEKKI